MSDNNSTLKIRIQIQQEPPQAIEEIYPEPEVIYEESLDWKKIFITALVLLTILALLGYLFFSSESSEKPLQDSAIYIPENTISPEKIEAEADTRDNSTETPLNIPINTRPTQSIPAKTDSNTITPKTVITPVRKPKKNSITDQSDNPDKSAPKTPSQSRKPNQTSDQPEVLRALLTHAIEGREPVDSIESVQLEPGEAKPIYFFMQLRNLQGKKIRVDWYLNNQLDSQLHLQVHNDNWRTHASKQLDHERVGSWRVELIDGSESQLATRDFTVTQN